MYRPLSGGFTVYIHHSTLSPLYKLSENDDFNCAVWQNLLFMCHSTVVNSIKYTAYSCATWKHHYRLINYEHVKAVYMCKKYSTFCFRRSTGAWWAFSFLFFRRIRPRSCTGDGRWGSSLKSLSKRKRVTRRSPNTVCDEKKNGSMVTPTTKVKREHGLS